MNWKHLLYIVPLVLIIGFLIGFRLCAYTLNTLDSMVQTIDKCSIQTLQYVAESNSDCQILVSGYLANCTGGSYD